MDETKDRDYGAQEQWVPNFSMQGDNWTNNI